MMYNILILGSGAREHAIAKSLFISSYQKKIFCIGSGRNPGIIDLCEEFIVGNINDPTFVVSYAKKCKVHFVIIGPENPLEAGIADGDTVIIKKVSNVDNGQIAVVLIDDQEATLKRVRKKGNTIALEAANRNYGTKIYAANRIKIQGKLVSLYRNFH